MLSVETYNANERNALNVTANRIVEACQTELFEKVGYPSRIDKQSGLQHYIDVMHENRDIADYQNLLGGFTDTEFELYKQIASRVAELSDEHFDKKIVPKGALIRAIFSYRFLTQVVSPNSVVLEIGPGSGYLGLLLWMGGYTYVGTDVTQAFYLHQNFLWQAFVGEDLIELADDDRLLTNIESAPKGKIIHVPWWKFTLPKFDDISLTVDAVVANNVLAEMNATSMIYSIKFAHHLMREDQDAKIFYVEGAGGNALREKEEVLHSFFANGYACQLDEYLHDTSNMTIFKPIPISTPAPKDEAGPAKTNNVAVNNTLKLFKPSIFAHAVKRSIGVLSRPSGIKAFFNHLSDFVSGRGTPSFIATPPINELTAALQKKFLAITCNGNNENRVSPKVLQAYQRELIGDGDLRTDDELFMALVHGLNKHY